MGNIHEIYICLLFSHQRETPFDEKIKGAHISFFFQIATFLKTGEYIYIYIYIYIDIYIYIACASSLTRD